MDHGTEGLGTADCAQASGEHTLDTQLHGDVRPAMAQTRALAHPGIGITHSAGENSLYRRTARIDFICNVMFAAVLVLGVSGAVLWRAAEAPARVQLIAPPVLAVSTPPPPPQAERALVHVSNPFDASEVFEFPAATTSSEAHDAMAKLLLQRARIRAAQGVVTDAPNPSHKLHRLAQVQPEEPAAKFYADAN